MGLADQVALGFQRVATEIKKLGYLSKAQTWSGLNTFSAKITGPNSGAIHNYRGAWSNTAAYTVGDMVLFNGHIYHCTADVPAAGTPTFVGVTGMVANIGATMPLATGVQAGDLAVLTQGSLVTVPSGWTRAVSGSASTSSIDVRVVSATDITNGTIPTGNVGGYGAIYFFRNVQTAAFKTTSNSTANTDAYAPTASGFAVATWYSNNNFTTTPSSPWVSSSGLVNGTNAMAAYAPITSGTAVPATNGTGSSTPSNAVAYFAGGSGLSPSGTNWTDLTAALQPLIETGTSTSLASKYTSTAPASGLELIETDTNLRKIGDGVTTWATLPYRGGQIVDTYIANGTWNLRPGAKLVHVFCVGSGCGGASGGRYASGTASNGGGGGNGAPIMEVRIDPADLSSSVTVVVGASAAGGASVTTDSTGGNAGGSSNPSAFGTYVRSQTGPSPTAPTSSTTSTSSYNYGSNLSASSQVGAVGSTSGGQGGQYSSGGGNAGAGSGGGGVNTGGTFSPGGVVQMPYELVGLGSNNQATGLGAAGANGQASALHRVGSGGAGGAGGNATTAGGNGGNGGNYGAGGGGGGASLNGAASGKGGNGAQGIVVVTTYF